MPSKDKWVYVIVFTWSKPFLLPFAGALESFLIQTPGLTLAVPGFSCLRPWTGYTMRSPSSEAICLELGHIVRIPNPPPIASLLQDFPFIKITHTIPLINPKYTQMYLSYWFYVSWKPSHRHKEEVFLRVSLGPWTNFLEAEWGIGLYDLQAFYFKEAKRKKLP